MNPTLTILAVHVTPETLAALRRLAGVRGLKPEDIAGEILHVQAQRKADLQSQFFAAATAMGKTLASS